VKEKPKTDHRETLRVTFDEFAELYDQMRPEYPESLINDVINFSEIPAKGRILELGCGTGKATGQFASRGYSIIGLDMGKDLAAVAARNFAKNENVNIEVSSFEDWDPRDHQFNMVMAATSFHWIEPEFRYFKTAKVLKSTGTLAVFWNDHVGYEEGFVKAVRPIYRKCAPSMLPNTLEEDRSNSIEPGEDLFQNPVRKSYPWTNEYSSHEYINLLNTYSGHIQLPDAEREQLFSEIKNLIDERFNGKILKHYDTRLELRKIKPAT